MKTISFKDFLEQMSSMFGSTTCVVIDNPSNRFNYSEGEVNDSFIEQFQTAESIEVSPHDDCSEAIKVMMANWSGDKEIWLCEGEITIFKIRKADDTYYVLNLS